MCSSRVAQCVYHMLYVFITCCSRCSCVHHQCHSMCLLFYVLLDKCCLIYSIRVVRYAPYPMCCSVYSPSFYTLLNVLVFCTMCLVFYTLLDNFDILWVAQRAWVSLKLGKLGTVILLDQVNRQLNSLHTGHSDL